MIPIIQYAILNAAIHAFKHRGEFITSQINEVRALASKYGLEGDPDYILSECRKEIALTVRKSITGGDVLRIEGF